MYFTSNGKPKGLPISKAFGFGDTYHKNLTTKKDTKKLELLELGASIVGVGEDSILSDNLLLLDVCFEDNKAHISYAYKGIKHIEKCFFDPAKKEFYVTPIHIEHENRFDDFRTSSAVSFIKSLRRVAL